MPRRGFTLIELLVVISIIAVLLAILLPAMSSSRRMGKMTVCMSNMRVLGQAVSMYAGSHDGRFPSVGFAHGGTVDEEAAWLNSMRKEYGSQDVLRCPSDQSPHWVDPVEGTTDQRRQMSYASNYYMTGKIPDVQEYLVLTRILRPSTTIYWAELTEEGQYAASDHVHPEAWWSDPVRLASAEMAITRHLQKANYAMIDGHAEPLKFEQTYEINYAASSFPDLAWTHNLYDPRIGW